MQLSSTAKYTIRILQFLAQNSLQQYSSTQISKELNISQKYLTKIMTKLTKNNITLSTKGKFGGFSLNKKLKDISIFDIIIIFDDIDNSKCVLATDIKCNFEQKQTYKI